jgi:hypothetical protein
VVRLAASDEEVLNMVRKALLLVSMLLAQQAVASSVSTVSSIACSGNLSVSLLDSAMFSCSGDFALSGGTISSDLGIVIASGGSLSLGDISIVAPKVELSAQDGVLAIGSGASIIGDQVQVWGTGGQGTTSPVALAPGSTITVGSGAGARVISSSDFTLAVADGTLTYDASLPTPIPIPGSLMPMLLGLLAVFGTARMGLPSKVKGARHEYLQKNARRTAATDFSDDFDA